MEKPASQAKAFQSNPDPMQHKSVGNSANKPLLINIILVLKHKPIGLSRNIPTLSLSLQQIIVQTLAHNIHKANLTTKIPDEISCDRNRFYGWHKRLILLLLTGLKVLFGTTC